MCVTIEEIWSLECEYSPGIARGTDKQIIKVVEELGEMCSDYLKSDRDHMKTELADTLNVLFGLAVHIFSSPEELATGVMNAIEKMAEKYTEEV